MEPRKMSSQAAPPPSPKSRRKVILATVVIVIPLIVLLTPAAVYGGFTVPVSRITFGETTGSLTRTGATATVQVQTVYEYMFSTRMGGRVRTAETDVSSSRGTANITISLLLTNPSGQTVDLGNVSTSGFIGTRNHTIVLGVEEGVRLPGVYHLDVEITADVAPLGGLFELGVRVSFRVDFTVS